MWKEVGLYLLKLKWVLVAVAVLLGLAGCAASTASKEPAATGPVKFSPTGKGSIPKIHHYADEWVGQYEGQGDVFDRSARLWVRKQATRLNIYPNGPNALVVQGFTNGQTGPRSFNIMDVWANSADEMSGESFGLERGARKFEFSLVRIGDEIAGQIKSFTNAGESEHGPYLPEDEWIFEVVKTGEAPTE